VFTRLGHSADSRLSTSSVRHRLGMVETAISSPNGKRPRKRSKTSDNGLAVAILQGLRSSDDKLKNREVNMENITFV